MVRWTGFALMLLLAAPTLALADAPPAYATASSSCAPLGFFAHLVPPPRCPSVRQEGTLTPLGCVGEDDSGARTCRIHVTGSAYAEGLPATRKVLEVEVQATGDAGATPVCAATSTSVTLSCSGGATFVLTLAPGQCREARVRATSTEGGVAPLTTRTELGFDACRAASGAFTIH